jgi:hypothetical protein
MLYHWKAKPDLNRRVWADRWQKKPVFSAQTQIQRLDDPIVTFNGAAEVGIIIGGRKKIGDRKVERRQAIFKLAHAGLISYNLPVPDHFRLKNRYANDETARYYFFTVLPPSTSVIFYNITYSTQPPSSCFATCRL